MALRDLVDCGLGLVTAELFERGYACEKRLLPWDWAFENVRLRGSPYGERFLIDETPWLRDPLGTLTDVTIQECVLMCCAQGGKTVTELVALGYALDQRPGLVMFAAQTLSEAKITAEEKIIPMIEHCPPLADSLPRGRQRHKKATLKIYFPNATLLIGPANESFFRGKTAHWVFGDECSQWKPGKIAQARARQTRVWNRKAFFASTPLECGAGAPGSEFAEAYKAGSQERYHLSTPCCSSPEGPQMIYLTSENLEKLFVWDPLPAAAQSEGATRSDVAKEGEDQSLLPSAATVVEWRKSVRLVCPKCGTKHEQTEGNGEAIWRKMIAGARYVSANPQAPPEKRSYAFNVLCLPPAVMPWHKIIEGWLSAKAEELKGNLAPLKEFVTLQLAEAWDARKFLSYSLPNFLEYDATEEWPEERFRAMTVDCQEHLAEFWVIVRAWGKDGSSRLLDFAVVHTEAEIVELQARWKVKAHLTALDCAYERYRVIDMCVRNGWTAMCGSDNQDWLHSGGEFVSRRMPFSEAIRVDARNGKSYKSPDGQVRTLATLFTWSNPSIKDILWRLKEGTGAPWAVCDLGPERSEIYAKGVDSERKREKIDRFGRAVLRWMKIRANHPWDAECMQVVFACLAKLFLFGAAPEKSNAEGRGETQRATEDGKKSSLGVGSGAMG